MKEKLLTEGSISKKLSSKNESKVKILLDKPKRRDFITMRPAWEGILPVTSSKYTGKPQNSAAILICKSTGFKKQMHENNYKSVSAGTQCINR